MKNETKWEAFEYEFSPKSANWFWVIWILAFGIFFTSYLFKNILFGILTLIITFSISLLASRKPDLLTINITPQKIIIKSYRSYKEINLESLESFWITKVDNNKKILFKSFKKTSPYIIIPLSSTVEIDQLRDYLLNFLKEEEHYESIFQILLEKIWA